MSFKSLSEDELKLHLREMWEFMYSKTRQLVPSKAASLVSRIMRSVPLPVIQQLLLDSSFVFSTANIKQVLEKCRDAHQSSQSENEGSTSDASVNDVDSDVNDEDNDDEDDDGDEDDDDMTQEEWDVRSCSHYCPNAPAVPFLYTIAHFQ